MACQGPCTNICADNNFLRLNAVYLHFALFVSHVLIPTKTLFL